MIASDPVIEALTRGGEVTAQGQFTLDMFKAREKLRQFQLPSPRLFVLELIGAAINGRASSIDVQTGLGSMTVRMNEVQPYTKTELAHLYANLFLPQEDASLDRLRQLAIGLNSGLALMPRAIILKSQHPRGQVLLRLTPTSEHLNKSGEADGSLVTTVTMEDAFGWASLRRLIPKFDEEIALIRGRCRHAGIPIRINHSEINRPVRLEPCLAQVHARRSGMEATLALASSLPVGLQPYLDEKERYGSLVWLTGHPFGAPLDPSRIVFMTSGVMLSDKRVELLPGIPIKVLCSAAGLMKNASQSDIVENARYESVLASLRGMVGELMEELRRTIPLVEQSIVEPHRWPREGSANFRKYLIGELDLARSYLKKWDDLEDKPDVTASPEPVVVSAAPPPVVERSREWAAHVDIDTPVGRGWMALPMEDKPASPFSLLWQERPIKLDPVPFLPARLAGTLNLSVDLRLEASQSQRTQVRQALSAAVDQLVNDVAADFSSFPPSLQRLVRGDIVEYLRSDRRGAREYQKVAPFSVMGQLLQAPIFRTTDGAFLTFTDLLEIFSRQQTLHFTEQMVSGRSLDPHKRVLILSGAERQQMSPLFTFTEYSHELEEEERARQMQRERGVVKPALDMNGVLAHTEFNLEGTEVCLALPRPYRNYGTIQYYKRGVLVEEKTQGALPCIGYVHSNALVVDADWRKVTLSDKLRQKMEGQVLELYESITAVLLSVEPAHPDYESCCRYVASYWRFQKQTLLSTGRPVRDPLMFPTRQGRRLGLADVIHRFREYGRVEVIPIGDLQLIIPEGVIVLTADRPWLRTFLIEFFGADQVVDWHPDEGPTDFRVLPPGAMEDSLEGTLQRLLTDLSIDTRVLRGSYGKETLCQWGSRAVFLNEQHALVRAVDKTRIRDPHRVLHLLLALLSERDPAQEGESGLQLRAVTAILRGLSDRR